MLSLIISVTLGGKGFNSSFAPKHWPVCHFSFLFSLPSCCVLLSRRGFVPLLLFLRFDTRFDLFQKHCISSCLWQKSPPFCSENMISVLAMLVWLLSPCGISLALHYNGNSICATSPKWPFPLNLLIAVFIFFSNFPHLQC